MPCKEAKQAFLKYEEIDIPESEEEEDEDESVAESDHDDSIEHEMECEKRRNDGKVQFLTLLKENCIGKKNTIM